MAGFVYLLGTLVTALCAALLLRFYLRVRTRLLLWSGLCFIGLTVTNALVFIDIVALPDIDLYLWRLGSSAAAMLLLVYGLVFESQ